MDKNIVYHIFQVILLAKVQHQMKVESLQMSQHKVKEQFIGQVEENHIIMIKIVGHLLEVRTF
jgi:hypothetical protein